MGKLLDFLSVFKKAKLNVKEHLFRWHTHQLLKQYYPAQDHSQIEQVSSYWWFRELVAILDLLVIPFQQQIIWQ